MGVSGHTATVVENEMIVLFGYNPEQGVSNLIQVFGLGEWMARLVFFISLVIISDWGLWVWGRVLHQSIHVVPVKVFRETNIC